MKPQTTHQLFQLIISNIDYALMSKKDKLHLQAMDAVKEVVDYRCLPPQIDYREPYERKSDKAIEFLESLPNAKKYFRLIEKETSKYYAPTENGYSVAEMEAMF